MREHVQHTSNRRVCRSYCGTTDKNASFGGLLGCGVHEHVYVCVDGFVAHEMRSDRADDAR